jgi:hypothetical protein
MTAISRYLTDTAIDQLIRESEQLSHALFSKVFANLLFLHMLKIILLPNGY